MASFNKREPEEFLLFIQNFQMTLKASGTLAAGANIQYICTLVHGEELRQLDTFAVEVVFTTTEHLNPIIFCSCIYCFPVNFLSKQNRVMRRGMRKPRELKVRQYDAHVIYTNDYLSG